jgi:hypothetical protein
VRTILVPGTKIWKLKHWGSDSIYLLAVGIVDFLPPPPPPPNSPWFAMVIIATALFTPWSYYIDLLSESELAY